MNDRIKDAFNMVHAEEGLKNNTKNFILRRTNNYMKRNFIRRGIIAAACFSLLLVFTAAGWVYFTPSYAISIDINPSIKLNINYFNKVISVEPYNDDGSRLAESINVKYMDYEDALVRILNNKKISELLAQDEILSIVVIDSDQKQREEILNRVFHCASEYKNAYCYSSNNDDVAKAHEHGLCYGKYQAFLILQELDPDITAEEINGMSMREIQELIENLSPDSSSVIPDYPHTTPAGSGHHPERNHGGNGGMGKGHHNYAQ